jgi:acetate kinase
VLANLNAVPDAEVHSSNSRVAVHVVRAREDLVIARAVRALLTSG